MSIIGNFKKVVFGNYANFKGRARRSEYWYFVLVSIVLQLIFVLPGAVSMAMAADLGREISPLGLGMYIIGLIISIALLIPTLAVAVRRLHDTGRSGWYYFIAFVPLVGGIILLYFFFQDSQPGTNKWGPNPKENKDIDTLGQVDYSQQNQY